MNNEYEMTVEDEISLDLQALQSEEDRWEAEMRELDTLDGLYES